VFVFSAAQAEEEWRREKHALRKTPMNEGNTPGRNVKRRPRVKPGDNYRRDSYTRAISRACEAAFPVPADLNEEEAKRWRREHHWHPHQLRHNAATRLRKEFGIDAAQIILGHRTLAVTAIYAEKDTKAAVEIMKKVG
jgi:integrase